MIPLILLAAAAASAHASAHPPADPLAHPLPHPLARSAEPGDAAYVACMDKAQTSLDYSNCASAALARADTRLNAKWRTLQGLVKDYGADARASLLAEERAWIAFKGASCQLYWGSGFGSMHRSIIGPQCLLQVVEARVANLDSMISALEPEG